MFPSTLQVVADELRAYASQVTGWMSREHKADGSHGALTADTANVSGTTTLNGYVVIDGSKIDTNTNEYQVKITRDGVGAGLTGGSPSVRISTDVAGCGPPVLYLRDSVNAVAGGLSPQIRMGCSTNQLLLEFNSANNAHLVVSVGDFVVSSAIRERDRAVAMGEWTVVAYNVLNFTASAGTWGVDNADQVTYAYTVIGKTMTLTWHIKQTDVSNAATLRLAIPGGFLAARQASGACRALDNGGAIVASACEVTAGVAYVTLYADVNSNNFSVTSSDNTYVFGTFTFEVQ